MKRSRVIRSATLVYLVTAATICARAQNAPARPVNDPAKMKWLLQEWQRLTDRLKTLDVHIYRVDKADRGRDETHYEGDAVFKSPNLASIDFWKLLPDAKGQTSAVNAPRNDSRRPRSHTERIVRGKDAVWQYLDDGRKVYIFPQAKGARQRVVDEGPLPFLFKVRANEAEARYQMSLVAENADCYLVKVLPKLNEDQESFKMAWLYLNKQFLLPTRITLVSPDGTSSREYRLSRQRPNAPVDDQRFQGGVLPGWTVQKNPATQELRQGQADARPNDKK
jgi:outer membrane lipoprotein-sorting protein